MYVKYSNVTLLSNVFNIPNTLYIHDAFPDPSVCARCTALCSNLETQKYNTRYLYDIAYLIVKVKGCTIFTTPTHLTPPRLAACNLYLTPIMFLIYDVSQQ
jgi:hypothetical protein